ncbi:MAG TPA: hypothetical protein VII75_04295 [Thermoanaerobaculia bacterium]
MNLEPFKHILEVLWRALVPGGVFVIKIVVGIAGVIKLAEELVASVKRLHESLSPADRKRRIGRRRRFAAHVVTEISDLDVAEDWNDARFSELEAEVEAEGRRRTWLGFPRKGMLSRERSLSEALRKSRERLILLEGEPGAGKSVALRHLAITIASSATKSRSLGSLIPLYINLKSIDRGGHNID